MSETFLSCYDFNRRIFQFKTRSNKVSNSNIVSFWVEDQVQSLFESAEYVAIKQQDYTMESFHVKDARIGFTPYAWNPFFQTSRFWWNSKDLSLRWIQIRDFSSEQFLTDEFTDVYREMKVVKWAEKIETDANSAGWRNASTWGWIEKVRNIT